VTKSKLEFLSQFHVENGIAGTVKDPGVSEGGLGQPKHSIRGLVVWGGGVRGAVSNIVGAKDSQFPEILSQVSGNQHGCGFLLEDTVESRSRPIGLGVVRCGRLEVNALGSPPVLDHMVEVLLTVVTADVFDDWGSWVVWALILQVLADGNEFIWHMVFTLDTYDT
jgi:hypothetical protein